MHPGQAANIIRQPLLAQVNAEVAAGQQAENPERDAEAPLPTVDFIETFWKIFCCCRKGSEEKPPSGNSEIIKKAKIDYEATILKDQKAVQSLFFNLVRDLVLGVFAGILLATFRREEGETTSTANGLIVGCAIASGLLALLRDFLDARREFLQNKGTRRKINIDLKIDKNKKTEDNEKARELKEAKQQLQILDNQLNDIIRDFNMDNKLKEKLSEIKKGLAAPVSESGSASLQPH